MKLLGVLSTFFIFPEVFSQSSASTYSALGIGEFNFSGPTHTQAMGGLGISFGTGWGINNVNPALSTRNTVFNFQAALNYRRINAVTSDQSEEVDGGGLSYLALSLPINSGRATLGMGLNQISSVNYNILVNGQVSNSNLSSVNRIGGDGGISEAYLSGGWVIAKGLSLGFHGSYLFGSTIRTNQLSLLNESGDPIGSSSEYFERLSISDVALKGGVQYFFKIGETSNLHLGAIYHTFGEVSGKEFAKIANFGQASRPETDGDIISNDIQGNVFIPNRLGYGVSYEKINKFVIGAEAQFQNFSQYRSFGGATGELGDAYKLGLGGQFTPDYFAVDNILKRATYRMGLEYQQTPYIVNQTQIKDIGINFGASIPMNNLSLLNLAVKVGSRGTTTGGLIRENYLNFSLGFSLNDNTWFYKRSFE